MTQFNQDQKVICLSELTSEISSQLQLNLATTLCCEMTNKSSLYLESNGGAFGSLLYNYCLLFNVLAGRVTTNEELEDMLETGNPSIFTSDVSSLVLFCAVYCCCSDYCHLLEEEE